MPARPAQASRPRPLVPVALAVAGGVLCGADAWLPAALAAGACGLGLAWVASGRPLAARCALLAAIGAAAAAWAYASAAPGLDDIRRQPRNSYVTITGVVCGDVYPHPSSSMCQVRVLSVTPPDGRPMAASGRVFAYLRASAGGRPPEYGDALSVHGRLDEPEAPTNPGGFDMAGFAARYGVGRLLLTRSAADWTILADPPSGPDWLPRLAARAREAFVVGLQRVLPSPRAELVASIVLGASASLPDALKDDFIATGTAHILAASGFNVAVVALCCLPLGRRLGLSRRASAILALAMVAAYVLVAGGKPSVVRAGVMAALFLIGELLDRDADAANIVAASAIGLLVADPAAIHDAGFQLSYAIVAAIVAGSPVLSAAAAGASEWVRRRRLPALAQKGAAIGCTWASTTLLAQLAALPLMAQLFGQVALTGIAANLLIAPLICGLTIVGLLTGALSLTFRPIALLVAPLAGLGATLVLGIARVCAELPWASLPTPAPGWPLVAAYGAVFWWLLLRARARLAGGPRRWETW